MKYLVFKEKKELNKKIIEIVRSSNIDDCSKKKLLGYLNSCGNTVYLERCNICDTKYFAGFWSCRSRFCAVCSYKLHLSRFRKVIEVLEKLGDYKLSHLVLTLKSMDNLKMMLKRIRSCLRMLDKDNVFRRKKKTWGVMGEIRNVEVKYGRVGWHVHIHVLIVHENDVRMYEDYKEIWKRVTDGEGSVFIRNVKNNVVSVLEVTKYNMKILSKTFLDMMERVRYLKEYFKFLDDDFFAEMYYSLKGQRLFSVTGIFRGVKDEMWDVILLRECKICGSKDFQLLIEKFQDVMDVELLEI